MLRSSRGPAFGPVRGAARAGVSRMDLSTAVALSMLPASRAARGRGLQGTARVCRQSRVTLEDVLDAARSPVADADRPPRRAHRERRGAARRRPRSRHRADSAGTTTAYPALLRPIADPPPVLWARGEPRGARRAGGGDRRIARGDRRTRCEVAARLAAELARRGMRGRVSGLARGVDSARRTRLPRGGRADRRGARLGPRHRSIRPSIASWPHSICGTGALVSELGPGAPPLPEHFPLRNRIISGISLAVVVVEARRRAARSSPPGARCEQGRDVMAVPGSVLSGRNRGSHAF